MRLPISRNQVDRLGKRLAASETTSDDDLAILQQVLAAYDEVKVAVLGELQKIGFTATGRTKTTGTLIDKLRRQQKMALSRVQDIAGARLVIVGTRRDQDEAVAQIVSWFRRTGSRALDPVDRRAVPSSGYRAVHVVVVVDGLPAEIQVRTELQDLWAQAYERLGDRWGRAIRYGGDPDEPEAPALTIHPDVTRRQIVDYMSRLSDQIHRVELARLNTIRLADGLALIVEDQDPDEYHAIIAELADSEDELAALEEELRGTLRLLVQFATEGA